MDATLRKTSRRWRLILVRVYMAVYAVLPMAYWRGVWTTADYYLLQYGWQAGLIEYVICEVVLNVFRVRQTAIFSPLTVLMDTRKDVLRPSTRFGVKPSLTWRYVLDAIVSNYIALTFSILLWRGAWVCIDHFFIPEDYIMSSVWSLVLGYGATLTILFMDPLLLKVARIISSHVSNSRGHFLALLVWEDAVYILAFWCHLFAWRGSWNLNAEYIIKDYEIGGWVNNMVGTMGFLVLQIYSYVGACGCVVDGHIDGTQDRWFSTHYLTEIVPYFRKTKNCCGAATMDDTSDTSSIKTEKGIYAVCYDNKAAESNEELNQTKTKVNKLFVNGTIGSDEFMGHQQTAMFTKGVANPSYAGFPDLANRDEFTHM